MPVALTVLVSVFGGLLVTAVFHAIYFGRREKSHEAQSIAWFVISVVLGSINLGLATAWLACLTEYAAWGTWHPWFVVTPLFLFFCWLLETYGWGWLRGLRKALYG